MDSVIGHAGGPAMSVIVVTPTNVGDLCLTLHALAVQTVCNKLELILVTPESDSSAERVRWLAGFHSVSIRRVPKVRSRGTAAAPAVRAACGEIIAFMENHVLPEPDWAEQILRAHEGPWAAVGPGIDGLMRSWVGRANGIVAYGRVNAHDRPQEAAGLPWHNTTYKRRAIEPFASQLDTLLDEESVLHAALRAQGQRLYLFPAARLRHMHVSNVAEVVKLVVGNGRLFAAGRASEWPWWRRAVYASAWPLFPFTRLAQMRGDFQRIARLERVWFLVPLVFAMLCGVAIGEVIGYLGGAGPSREWLIRHEMHFFKRASPADRRRLKGMIRAVNDLP